MPKEKPTESLPVIAEKLGIGHYRRHVFLCIGTDCCTAEEGEHAWQVLKKQMKDRGLSLSVGPNACYRTKAQCLRVCTNGPILVVYPDGTWYQGMTADRIPRFVQEHLVEGRPVAEWVFAANPLPHPGADDEQV
jgi:(2Fe-2S) ferredoxin